MYSMCRLYVISSDDPCELFVLTAGCFTSNRNFLTGGGLVADNPSLAGTFLIFLNLFLSCPSTVNYILL